MALANAQSPPAAPAPAMAAVSAALGHMKTGGAPLVVVVTSAARPESRAFCRALIDGPWARANRGLVQVVELPAEGNAATVERLRVTAMPAVLAYTAGPEGPACRGMKAGGSPDEAAAWLGSMGIGDAADGLGDGRPGGDARRITTAIPRPSSPYYAPPRRRRSAGPPCALLHADLRRPPRPAPTYVTGRSPMMARRGRRRRIVQLPGPNVVVQQGQPQVFVTPAAGRRGADGRDAADGAGPANLYLPAAGARARAGAMPARWPTRQPARVTSAAAAAGAGWPPRRRPGGRARRRSPRARCASRR